VIEPSAGVRIPATYGVSPPEAKGFVDRRKSTAVFLRGQPRYLGVASASRGADVIVGLRRPKRPVAGIAQAGNDVAVVVEFVVDGDGQQVGLGHRVGEANESRRGGDRREHE